MVAQQKKQQQLKAVTPSSSSSNGNNPKPIKSGLSISTHADDTKTKAELATPATAIVKTTTSPRTTKTTMNDSQHQQSSAAAAAATGAANPSTNLNGGSVVNDLLQVYNNMTQSKTPHVPQQPTAAGGGGTSTSAEGGGDVVFEQGITPPGHRAAAASSGYTVPPPIYQRLNNVTYDPARAPPSSSSPQVSTSHGAHQSATFNFDSYQPQQEQHALEPSNFSQHQQHSTSDAANDTVDMDDGGDEEITASGRARRKRRASASSYEPLLAKSSSSVNHEKGGGGKAGGGSSSNGSVGGKAKKKSKNADGRWSKRFTWPEDLHRDFVSAIFDVGLKHASPSAILEQMPKHPQITTERIKSHLQKYRLHRVKSKKEFISSYEGSLRSFQSRGGVKGVKSLAGGEMVAHLTYTTSTDAPTGTDDPTSSASASDAAAGSASVTPVAGSKDGVVDGSAAAASDMAPGAAVRDANKGDAPHLSPSSSSDDKAALMLPQLTEAEKQSPIGSAMGYLMGLFFSLKQQLMIQRSLEAAGEKARATPVQDVFNSFVVGGATAPGMDGAAMAQAASVAAATHPTINMPSVRTHMEENSLMKREMQNQMALQNKMRALKQQELAKYENVASSTSSGGGVKSAPGTMYGVTEMGEMYDTNTAAQMTKEADMATVATSTDQVQGAGEMDGTDVKNAAAARARGLSLSNPDDFWNNDVVDEQLFEFLMNN